MAPMRISAAPEPPTELQLALQVEASVSQQHADALSLLNRLIVQSSNEVARLSGGARLASHDQRFCLLMLAQSINASWMIRRAIVSGYPRWGLALARFLRESHIAFLWAKARPAEASEAYGRMLEGEDGRWPTSGDMAKVISADLRAEGSAKGERWIVFMLALGHTHNDFAHAVWDTGLIRSFEVDLENVFVPYVGPKYERNATTLAFDHVIPLLSVLLNDAENFVDELASLPRSAEAVRLLTEADDWWQQHPIPLASIPVYPSESAPD